MNVKNLRNSLSIISNEIGIKLNPFETILIEQSLRLLQHDNKLSDVYFWGRVETLADKCYYIAFGYIDDVLSNRRFFYSLNSTEWFLLPPEASDVVFGNQSLTGNPAHLIEVKQVNMHENDRNRNASSPNGREEDVHRMREEDRLATLVNQITDEAALLPRGALYRRPDNRIIPNCNPGYGPVAAATVDPADYQHLTIGDKSHVKTYDHFAITIDNHEKCFYIKSLQWPGMIMFHERSTNGDYGFVYFGDGRKNFDVPSMI